MTIMISPSLPPPAPARVEFLLLCFLLLFLCKSTSMANESDSVVSPFSEYGTEEETARNWGLTTRQYEDLFLQGEDGFRSLPGSDLPSITREELDLCWNTLGQVSVNGLVERQQYVLFLETFSSRSLAFSHFDDLPLSLVLIFYTAACAGGQFCNTVNPSIKTKDLEGTPLLTVFCTTVKDIAAVQIEFIFQYLIRYQNGYSALQILRGNTDSTIRKDLEEATELVLAERFGCDDELTQRRTREEAVASELQRRAKENMPWNMTTISALLGSNASQMQQQQQQQQQSRDILQGGLRRRRRRDQEPPLEDEAQERMLQRVGLPLCDFRVAATIKDMFNIECMDPPPESEDTRCAVVVSETKTTAASLSSSSTASELRVIVAEELKYAFTGNRLAEFLA